MVWSFKGLHALYDTGLHEGQDSARRSHSLAGFASLCVQNVRTISFNFLLIILSSFEFIECYLFRSDLKPDNVFVSTSLDLVVGDFGVAVHNNGASVCIQGASGTPVWMAPEELSGGAVDSRCDVWSLGCILVEILTCRHFSNEEMLEKIIALRTNAADLKHILGLIAQVSCRWILNCFAIARLPRAF